MTTVYKATLVPYCILLILLLYLVKQKQT